MNPFPAWFAEKFHHLDIWPNLDAYVMHGRGGQVGFQAVDSRVEVPEHAHDAQWGVVLDGQIDFTIGGEAHVFRKGDSYNIPAGVPHAAIIHPGTVWIEVWENMRFPQLAEAHA
ncbi:MAG: cupin domain-containing protein [Chloroflexaceae bacterium]|jgi:quercetin dioxygenase-like cupin family protein|nr:cupin domain-containing protein [Chloroflexaceae bacterium]